jgi:hypothetical protein
VSVGTIYGLCEPDGELRYIGKTARSPARRLAQHISDARRLRRPCHLFHWIRSLLAVGKGPTLWLLEADIPVDDLNHREKEWIAACRVWDCRLVNATDGGEGTSGCYPSAETRAKLSVARLGKPMPPEVCAKISATHSGRPKSSEHKAKVSAGLRGKTLPPETRAKLSVSLKGRSKSAEHREKIGAAHRGRVKSPEHRAKLSAANTGKKLGVKFSPERRAAISAGLLRRSKSAGQEQLPL